MHRAPANPGRENGSVPVYEALALHADLADAQGRQRSSREAAGTTSSWPARCNLSPAAVATTRPYCDSDALSAKTKGTSYSMPSSSLKATNRAVIRQEPLLDTAVLTKAATFLVQNSLASMSGYVRTLVYTTP